MVPPSWALAAWRRLLLVPLLLVALCLGCVQSKPPTPPPASPSGGRGTDAAADARRPLDVAFGEPSEPAVAERAIASGTSVVFDGERIHGRFAVSHGRLLASGTRPMHIELRMRADEGEVARAPAAFVLVVDTSGSMSGVKMSGARRAAAALLDEMSDDDAVSIVRFSDDAEVVVPLRRVRDVRERARAEIGKLFASGSTNIVRGISAAVRELERADGGIRRIALVTDGRDTSGAPRSAAADVARREAERGVTVSTLGIGLDYDDAYLANLAAAGHGNYEFMNNGAALARFLSKELRETSRTTVERAVVELTIPAQARIRDVWGATWEPTTGGARLVLGSLFAGDERRVIVSVDVSAGDPGSSVVFGARASWLPVGGRRVAATSALRVESVASARDVDVARDLSVLASVTSVISSRRESEASAAFERGDVAKALTLNQESLDELDRAAAVAAPTEAQRLRAQRRAYEKDAAVYKAPTAAPAAAAREIGAREHGNAARSAAY